MDVTKLPNILKASEVAKYQVGELLFMAFKDIPPTAGIEYLYALLVVSLKTKQPVLCVTAETMSKAYLEVLRSPMAGVIGTQDAEAVIDNNNPFICVIGENDIRQNLGSSPDWKNQNLFLAEAKKAAMKRLGLNPQQHPTITKPALTAGRHSNFLPVFGVVVIIGSILAYWAYSSSESDEQKSFMLGCLSQHSEAFCERIWAKN